MKATLRDVPPPALVLGVAGLVPFVAGAIGAWTLEPEHAGLAIPLQFFYAAVVLSFLGAVHWGPALAGVGGPPGWGRLTLGVVPCLAGWALTALDIEPLQMGLALTLAFPAVLAGDLAAARRGMAPAWYMALRTPLTIVATLSLAASTLRFVHPPGG
ncbi:MAG: DUF3429 domain-containing protein [Alphaproteobacteria bacterium]|nr:DUF3429 domain-containing protein [Alphaproteobacteria bacterium]